MSDVSAASPVITRKLNEKTLSPSKIRDIIIAVNTGVVTSYSGDGDFQWQLRNGPTWDIQYKANSVLYDVDANRVQDVGSHDSHGAHMLVVGQTSMSMYSQDGDVLASIEIPSVPVGKPLLVDFDSDGINDVIVLTDDAIMGYRLEVFESTNGLLIAVIIMLVIATLVFVANIRTDSSQSSSKILSIVRSTDLHDD